VVTSDCVAAYRACYACFLEDGVVVLAMVHGKGEQPNLARRSAKKHRNGSENDQPAVKGRRPTMTKRAAHGPRGNVVCKGQEVVDGSRELADTLATGQPLERTCELWIRDLERSFARGLSA
jgi:hypothetical protein